MSADRVTSLAAPFGLLLRRYRTAAGLTQEEVAARAGLSVRGISDLERGLKRTPRRATVELLAGALALPPRKRALLEAAARPMADPAHAAALAATAAPPPPSHNLPAQVTSLIGREGETLAAAQILARADVRLLTLTGPGGVGKSRLALHVAEDAIARFEDGVCAVLLAALRDPALVMPAIARALGLRPAPGEPPDEQVCAALRDRELLLLLDNFEHLPEAAPRVATLLASCPRLKVLVTSRAPLKLGGEHELAVAPLADDAAAELFIQRARAARAGLEVAPEDLPVVEAICRRVDRLPLAIELAAVWAKVLSLPALLERLSGRLDLLTDGRRDAPERQRTLRDTVAWSEHLLEPNERRLFRRLAIFAGGCAPEAVEALCGDGVPAGGALAGLAALVDKSLLQAETGPEGEPRFGMLETIRAYALERLAASGEAEALTRRHADYYAGLVNALGWLGPEQDAHDRRLERELPNARAALAWAIGRRELGLGLRLAVALGRFWYSRGAFDEGERWLRELLALEAATDGEAAPAPLRVMARYFLILYALDRHHFDRAEALAREGLELARRHGDAGGAGNMLTELGHVAEARGDLDAAATLFEEGLAQLRAAGVGGAVGRTLSSLGNLARARGDYERARSYLEESIAWARERSFSWAVASGLASLGHVACEQGDFARATALYREALGLYRTMPNPAALAACLEGVAVAVAATGDHERVARLCGAVAGLREAARADPAAEWPPFVRRREAARRALGAERFAAACAEGGAFGPARAIAYARAAPRAHARNRPAADPTRP